MITIAVDAWSFHGLGQPGTWATTISEPTSGTQNTTQARIRAQDNGGGVTTCQRVIVGFNLTGKPGASQVLFKVTDEAGDLTPARIHVSDVTPQSVSSAADPASYRKMFDAHGTNPLGTMTQVGATLVWYRDVTAWWNANVGGWAWLGLVESDYDFTNDHPIGDNVIIIENPGDAGAPFLEYSPGLGIIGDDILP